MKRSYDVIIIGGGLAGTSLAYHLARRGLGSIILERGRSLAAGASGNMLGLAIPYVTSELNPAKEVYDRGFTLLESILTENAGLLESVRIGPALQFPSADRPKRLMNEALTAGTGPALPKLSEREGRELSGLPIAGETLLYEKSMTVSPPELCAYLASNERITTVPCAAAVKIRNDGSSWAVLAGSEEYRADTVVVSNAYESKCFEQTKWLFLAPVRGQLATFDANAGLGPLKIPLCFDGYLLPSCRGRMLIGATYSHIDMSAESSPEDERTLFERLARWIPSAKPLSELESRVSFRTSTFDRLPYAGLLPDFAAVSSMRLRWSSVDSSALPRMRRFYVSAGFGSRGLLSAPLAGLLLAAQIAGDPADEGAGRTLDPMRLILRMIRREEIKMVERV